MVPTIGIEPTTYWLQVSCSAYWAKSAFNISIIYIIHKFANNNVDFNIIFIIMGKAKVNKTSCIGCGACVASCPHAAISIGPDGKAAVDQSKCVGCKACESVCPISAICVQE